jgi:1-deoxy-D-xylulose-5-phosphate reductoisomerase
MNKKKIIILGSTGSIGKITFEIIAQNKNNFSVELLSTNQNLSLAIKQVKKLNVKKLIVTNKKRYLDAVKFFKKSDVKIYNSFNDLNNCFKDKEIYYSMISIVGLAGLKPSIDLIKKSKNIAIVNKESIICGWSLIKKKLDRYNTNFIPIDSEHFSIYSLLNSQESKIIDKIYITASGGPFLNQSLNKLGKIKISQALKHPTWKMGKKISIDSSTMMNKVFEVIEAKKLFNIKYKNIKILTHPKSYLHSIIKLHNGLIKLLAHEPNMKIPIFNSIYLDKTYKITSKKIDLKILNNLNLNLINEKKFPLVKIIKILPEKNTLYETALISINDFFVNMFLKKKIDYKKMIKLIFKYALHKSFLKFRKIELKKINDIYKIEKYIRIKLEKENI